MKYFISKITVLVSVLTLVACKTTTNHSVSMGDVLNASQSQLHAQLSDLNQIAVKQTTFVYTLNDENYQTYTQNGKPLMIESKVNGQVSQFYYQNGRLFAVILDGAAYQFNAQGKLQSAVSNDGSAKSLSQEELRTYETKLNKQATYLSQKLVGTSANVARVRTGADAKLNYLCIAKLQQVAGTKRVFRSSVNRSGNSNRLSADIRLNGNQYYVMDCQLEGERVVSLNLQKK